MASLQQPDVSVVAPEHTFVVAVKNLEDQQLQQLAQDHPTVYRLWRSLSCVWRR
jgi:hypothetical protein